MNESEKFLSFSLEALRRRDRQEMSRLVEAFSGVVYRLGMKMLGDPQDAEDVLQSTFLKVFEALPTFEGRSSLSTWIYRIAMNEALMILRRRRPEVGLTLEEGNDEDDEPLPKPQALIDWCCLPENELLSGEARRVLDEAIRKLPEKLRTVFILRDIEGLSTEETAEALGLSETNVKTRLLRARLRLREMLSEYYGERVKESGLYG
jgi:RNA polymerase sigma-70 factor (ECF subfamily)